MAEPEIDRPVILTVLAEPTVAFANAPAAVPDKVTLLVSAGSTPDKAGEPDKLTAVVASYSLLMADKPVMDSTLAVMFADKVGWVRE